MKTYLKALVHVLAVVLAALVPLLNGGHIAPSEWVNVAILGIGSAGVYFGPNVPGAAYTKSVLAVLTAVLAVLASVITGGVNTAEWLQIVLAALGAVGVYGLKNKPALFPATDKIDSQVL